MRTLLLLFLQVVLLFCLVPSPLLHAQAPPADFMFSATIGGSAPWEEKARITIDNAGLANYSRYTTGDPPAVLAESTFTVSPAGLQQLWKAIQDSSFFTLDPVWNDSTVHDGMFARVSVTANGTSHQVAIRNIAQPRLQAIIGALNAVLPASLQLEYTPPEQFNLVPREPCDSASGGAVGTLQHDDPRLQNIPDPKLRALLGPDRPSSPIIAAGELTHPGTVVAYNVPLRQAIRRGIATTRSKGEVFGDGVSISVDNTNVPPPNTVSITLYLEFWGPQATQANIDAIELDIARKWSGHKTSTGQTVEIGFVTRRNTGASSPPNTAGYHQIKLVPKGTVRSHVSGNPGVNEGVGSGVWELGQQPGMYGHEAGHLMGLPDRYVDYNKQPDGSWVNAKTGQAFANSDLFASHVVSKYPGSNLAEIKSFLAKADVYSIPLDGSENDLMANVSKPVRQADIDLITANPGLLVTVPPGSVFANRSRDDQNLVVTRADYVFVKKGERRTLNGIYAACIDLHKGIPGTGGLMDVTVPVSSWTGVLAAEYMARLVQYIDSAGLYCGIDIRSQEAIWRISDNSLPFFSGNIEEFLNEAGVPIMPGQILDFPHLTGGSSTDTVSFEIIPTELFVANFRPRFAHGQVGSPAGLTASVSAPAEVNGPTAISWTATGPDGAPAPVTAVDSTASLTPARSGIYEVALTISVSDSLHGERTFTADRKGYVIVPDNDTETFEHANLTDSFPWKSFGNVPWKISSLNAQTGSFAAQPGEMLSGQTSTLGLEVELPADSVIIFSVRTANAGIFEGLAFAIDSLDMEVFGGLSDWTIVKFPLSAGRHVLTWSTKGDDPATLSNIWLDNIFFPGNVVVTSVADAGVNIPRTIELAQNYPNPFNPTTLIRYSLPQRSNVTLSVYTTLGQKVADLAHGVKEAGYHEIRFDGSRMASGVYFYRLRVTPLGGSAGGGSGDFMQTRKLILIR